MLEVEGSGGVKSQSEWHEKQKTLNHNLTTHRHSPPSQPPPPPPHRCYLTDSTQPPSEPQYQSVGCTRIPFPMGPGQGNTMWRHSGGSSLAVMAGRLSKRYSPIRGLMEKESSPTIAATLVVVMMMMVCCGVMCVVSDVSDGVLAGIDVVVERKKGREREDTHTVPPYMSTYRITHTVPPYQRRARLRSRQSER